jgi:predicted metal-dependent peptidase
MPHPSLLQRDLARLILRHPFLSSLALRLERIADPATDTAWTDGVHLAVNPSWFVRLDDDTRLTVLGHECFHIALGHHLRRCDRDLERWNRACDYAVNALLVGDGFRLPAGALHDPAFGDASAEAIYNRLPASPAAAGDPAASPSSASPAPATTPPPPPAGATPPPPPTPHPAPPPATPQPPPAAQAGQPPAASPPPPPVAASPAPPAGASFASPGAPSSPPPSGNTSSVPPGTPGTSAPAAGSGPAPSSPAPADPATPSLASEALGEVRDHPSPGPLTPAQRDARLAEHAILVTALAQQARAAGRDSAGVRRAKTAALASATVDWRALLIEFLSAPQLQDHSWHRPNPRYAPLGLFLPLLVPVAPRGVGFVIDTSGSVPKAALDAVTAELEAFLLQYPAITLDVIYADAEVAGRASFTAEDLPLRLQPIGGGGTHFGPALAAFTADDEPPACVVYLTDLAGRFPDQPPPMPIIWLVFGEPMRPPAAPFGRVVLLPY